MDGKKMILPALYKFLITKNINDKVKIVFDLYENYKISKEDFIKNIGELPNTCIPSDIIYPKEMKILDLKNFKTQEVTIPNIIHSIAHIEYNAMSIYCDTLIRSILNGNDFLQDEKIKTEFYMDFLSIVRDEAYHFSLLNEILLKSNIEYGDIIVHDKLWNNCINTKDDILARIAIIALVQEARGLDAGPKLISKLNSLQDLESANVMKTIVNDEVNHVKIGYKWFIFLCKKMNFNNEKEKFKEICSKYLTSPIHPPFNRQLRKKAGLPEDWYHNKL